MKLGALKSAIRALTTAPKTIINLPNDRQLEIHAQKGPLLEGLDTAYPGGKATETFLTVLESGHLVEEPSEDAEA